MSKQRVAARSEDAADLGVRLPTFVALAAGPHHAIEQRLAAGDLSDLARPEHPDRHRGSRRADPKSHPARVEERVAPERNQAAPEMRERAAPDAEADPRCEPEVADHPRRVDALVALALRDRSVGHGVSSHGSTPAAPGCSDRRLGGGLWPAPGVSEANTRNSLAALPHIDRTARRCLFRPSRSRPHARHPA